MVFHSMTKTISINRVNLDRAAVYGTEGGEPFFSLNGDSFNFWPTKPKLKNGICSSFHVTLWRLAHLYLQNDRLPNINPK